MKKNKHPLISRYKRATGKISETIEKKVLKRGNEVSHHKVTQEYHHLGQPSFHEGKPHPLGQLLCTSKTHQVVSEVPRCTWPLQVHQDQWQLPNSHMASQAEVETSLRKHLKDTWPTVDNMSSSSSLPHCLKAQRAEPLLPFLLGACCGTAAALLCSRPEVAIAAQLAPATLSHGRWTTRLHGAYEVILNSSQLEHSTTFQEKEARGRTNKKAYCFTLSALSLFLY